MPAGDSTPPVPGDADGAVRHEVASSRVKGAAAALDDVVQGMVTARWALDAGDHQRAVAALDHSLVLAQALATELLGEGGVEPGELVRKHPRAPRPTGPE